MAFELHLLKQPHLRAQVKSLAVDVLDSDFRRFDDGDLATLENRLPRSFVPTAEIEQLVKSAEKACPGLAGLRYEHGEVSWSEQVGLRSPDAIIALVVAWAIDLQELDLTLTLNLNVNEWEPDPWLL